MRVPLPAAMMTMFNAMRRFPDRARIIGRAALATVLLLALAACSSMRLGYNQGPHLAYWWLDGYADFNVEQTPRVKRDIEAWFAWHRHDQLPQYARLLARAQNEILERGTPAQACGWQAELRQRAELAYEHALPALAEVAVTLSPQQIQHVEARLRKADQKFRDEFAQPDPRQRHRAAVKRSVERAEMLYGRLSDAQRDWIDRSLAASPYDALRVVDERAARGQDIVRTLRELPRLAGAAERQAALRALGRRFEESPRPAYRDYQARMNAFNCALMAQLHDSATPAQKQIARTRLRGWEEDARALAGEADEARRAPQGGSPGALTGRAARSPGAG